MKNKTASWLMFSFMLFSLFSSGQTISGNITDTIEKKNVANVVIALLKTGDSTLYKFTRSNSNGQFVLQNLSAGKYILMITHPFYADFLYDIDVPAEGLDLKNIAFLPKSKLLQEIILKTGTGIRIKGDTTIFTADSFKVSANANVEELLKKLPGIQVDKNGEIKAMGEKVEKVLVDGEEFFGDDPGMAVKNLRADAVKEVQVFDKKSDQAEFTGIDDGQTKKTINLKLKEDKKHGYFGKIDLAGGLQKNIDNRYNSNLLFNSFKGKRKIAGYLLKGNTGQDGLNWQDSEKYGADNDNVSMNVDDNDGSIMYMWNNGGSDDEPYVDPQNGFFKNTNAGLQYSNKWNEKQTLSISPKYNEQDYINTQRTFTQTQLADSFFNDNANENIHVINKSFKLNATYDIKIDSSNSLKFTAKGNFYNLNNQSYRTSASRSKSGMLNNTSNRQSNSITDKQSLNGTVLFKHKFKKPRRTLSFNIDWNLLNSEGINYLQSDNEIYSGGILSYNQLLNQQKDYDKSTQKLSTKATYTEPLGKKYSLELNYEFSVNKGSNNQVTHSYSPVSGKYDQYVDSLTNLFDQVITVNKPGFKINYTFKKLKFNFGSGFGITHFDLKDNTLNRQYTRDYTNIFPSASLNYSYRSNHNVRFTYTGNTTQPTINQLQNLRDNNDFFNQYLGNPLLKPSFRNQFNLSHNSYNFIKDMWMYQSVNFAQTSNAITNSRTIFPDSGKTITQPINTNGNYSISFWGGIGMKLKKLDLHVNLNPNFNYSRNIEVINSIKNTSKNLNSGISLSVSKEKDKRYEFSISNNFSYNSNSTQQNNGRSIHYNTNELSADATIYLKKVWSLNTNYTFYKRQKTEQFSNSLDNHLWNARLQRTFKQNEFTAYISVKDILNQNTGIDRSFYSNTLTEVRNDRLLRYWMVGFTWDFKNKGAKATSKE